MTTEEKYAEALTKIATYILPVFKKAGGEYVPVGNVTYLREIARKALGLPRVSPTEKPKP
jgi:hypothetical protein